MTRKFLAFKFGLNNSNQEYLKKKGGARNGEKLIVLKVTFLLKYLNVKLFEP